MSAWQTEKSFTRAHYRAHLESKAAKPITIAAKAKSSATRSQVDSSKARPEPANSDVAASQNTVGLADSNPRTIETKVAAARMLAERITAATAIPPADAKSTNGDNSARPEALVRGNAEKTAPAHATDSDLLVAVVMTRPTIKSVSDLTGKSVAIDERYASSNGSIRTAIVAAGAREVQLSEGQNTAINRLVNGEVPAAVLALVSTDAAEAFPEIAGFKIFHIPLSPRSLKP